MERFELNEIYLRLYKDKTNGLKKLKFKNVNKGFIYSENGQYAGCVAIDKNFNIIYFEVMDTFNRNKDLDVIISNSINLLNGQEITLPNTYTEAIIKFQQKGFRLKSQNKKEVTLTKFKKV